MKKKAVIFDLDDTLISTRVLARLRFMEVSRYLEVRHDLDSRTTLLEMMKEYDELNRKKILDLILEKNGLFSEALLKKLILICRRTDPRKSLYPDVIPVLKKIRRKKLDAFLITDGIKTLQSRKIKRLQIEDYFSRVIFTYSFGEKNKKPGAEAFRYLLSKTGLKPSECLAVGDNPYRDFVNVKKEGILTLRIFRPDGTFQAVRLSKKYEADSDISSLQKIFEFL